MIVHKCDYCKKEMKGKILSLNLGEFLVGDLELCSSKCVIDYVKAKEKRDIELQREFEETFRKESK